MGRVPMTEKPIGAPGNAGRARQRPAASADAPSPEAVSEQLRWILSSPSFQASERRKRFRRSWSVRRWPDGAIV
jgi:hypothetical protein